MTDEQFKKLTAQLDEGFTKLFKELDGVAAVICICATLIIFSNCVGG